MGRYLLDTSCLVAAVCAWHEHHEVTLGDIERRRRSRETPVIAGHSLVESYAVLTRLPAGHRLSAQDALTLLETNWGEAEIVTLAPSEHWKALRAARDQSVAGGAVYDALIAACAVKGRVRTLLTWNLAHFERFAGPGLEVAAPRA